MDSSRRNWMLGLLLLAAAVRLGLILALSGSMYKGDGAEYRFYAHNLETYGIYSGEIGEPPRPGFDRMPGEPLLIWFMHLFVADDSAFMLLPHLVASLLMLWLLMRMVQIFDLWNALARKLLLVYALVPALDFYVAQFYPEVPAAFCTLFSFGMLGHWMKYRNWQAALLAGVAIALGACFRPEVAMNLLIAGGVFLFSGAGFKPGLRAVAIAVAGFALLLSPWILRNAANEKRFIPLGDNFFIESQDSLAADQRGCSRGLYSWLNTWHYREKQVKQVAWDFLHADLDALPATAFASAEEKALVKALQSKPQYDCGSDRVLQQLAAARRKAAPLQNYLLLPAQRIFFLLFRVERFDSLSTTGAPEALVTLAWMVLAAVSNFVQAFALIGAIFFRSLPALFRWMLAGVWLRLIFFAWVYHVEVRYMLLFYPELFLIALFLLSRWTQKPTTTA